MRKLGQWLVVAMVATGMGACGGGDDEVSLPSAEALCGSLGLNAKIINGANCGQPERSSVILLNVTSSTGTAVCSGTLIAPTKILTAAHCLPAGTRRVLAGVWNANGTVVGMPARSWVVHPQFQRSASVLANDAAVIFLPSPMPNPTMGVLLSDATAAGQSVYVAGWGEPGFSLAVGLAQLGRVNDTSVGFTYAGKLSNTCNGDSGGPAYRSINGRPGVVGITSTGTVQGCGEGDQSLFTNVQGPAVIGFIRSQAPEAAYF